MRVFVSYSSGDRPFAERLAKALTERDLHVWYDRWEIKVGDSIVGKIADGIEAADALVIVLSPRSVASTWVAEELNAATMRAIESKDLLLLPVLAEPCQIPALLRHRRYANFASGFDAGLLELLESLIPLQRLWTNLGELNAEHQRLVNQLLRVDDDTEVTGQITRLHQLMTLALDVRLEIELRRDLASSPASAADLFDKIALLAEHGLDVRSRTWNDLVWFRSSIAHEASSAYSIARLMSESFGRDYFEDEREAFTHALARLSQIMSALATPQAIVRRDRAG